jgi:exoribonuclease R
VVGIIRRNWRQYAGTIVLDNKETSPSAGEGEGDSEDTASSTAALFLPVDAKLPPVRISSRCAFPRPESWLSPYSSLSLRRIEELLGKRVLVAVDHWPAWSSLPFGHYVRILGVDGVKEVETQVSPCAPLSPPVMTVLLRRFSFTSMECHAMSSQLRSWLACHRAIGRSLKRLSPSEQI